MMLPYIRTASGIQFNLETPQFRVEDIAHALTNMCRFGGHTKRPFSVMQHSLLVSAILYIQGHDDYALEGLLHDAGEAYLVDMPSPWKVLLPDYCALERQLDKKLRAHFGLPEEMSPEVKQADWYALFIEAYHLMPSKGADFYDPEELRAPALLFAKEERVHAQMASLERAVKDDFVRGVKYFQQRQSCA